MPDDSNTLVIDYRSVGATGLKRFSGFVYEDFLQELTGSRAAHVYKEMSDNDAVISSFMFIIDKLVRRVPWRIQEASKMEFDLEAAEFVESCINDMEDTWIDTIAEILSMLVYGYSVHELNYKRRCGDGFDPTMRSKYSDGRIGWRSIPIRSQDTIYRWQFDDHGGIQGVEQLAPPHYYHVTIPVEKMLLFRTTTHKNNPEGRSILRGAYRSWYMKKNIENIEAIGIERDLAGIPMAMVPPDILSQNASTQQKALLGSIKTMVTNVRRDEQEGLVFPMAYDPNGKPLYDFKLLTTGGTRQFDTDKVIQRYDHRIAMNVCADFMLIGGKDAGSWALHTDKTKLFASSIGAFLDITAEVLNRFAIPRLMALNDFQMSDHPKIMHGDLSSNDIKELGDYVLKMSQAGMPLFPDEKLENHLRKAANLPEVTTSDIADPDQMVEPENRLPPEDIQEIPGSPLQIPTGLDTPADTTPVNQKPPIETSVTNETGNTERTGYRKKGVQTPAQYTDWRKW